MGMGTGMMQTKNHVLLIPIPISGQCEDSFSKLGRVWIVPTMWIYLSSLFGGVD